MTTPISVSDDNLAYQIMEAMDGLRTEVWHDPAAQPHWHDRLVDADGLEAQKAHLEELKWKFQQAVESPPEFLGLEDIHCVQVDCQACWVCIFESAIHDLDFWKQELDYQILWMDATFWASRNGHTVLAKRLGHAYRLFYGARPILNQIASFFVPSGRTVRAVANEIRARAFDCPNTEPEHQKWHLAQGAEFALDNIKDRQARIGDALEALGLLDDPVVSEIRRLLHCAYEAASIMRCSYELDDVWCTRIFAALDDGNVSLAAALMRYYGSFFGTVYLFQGLRIDRPPLGFGHVPDDPTAEEAKACLLECNRLRAAWIDQQDYAEKGRAARERNHAASDASAVE